MEIKRYCATCAYKSNDIFDDECRWCNMTSDSMSGWTPAENKPLSDYTDSELEEELARRKAASEEKEKAESMKKWLDGFIIGDYYKITYMGNPSMFVIVRADERKTPTYTDEPYIKCTNVYDNDMGWTSKPHIYYNIITNNAAYTIEHLTKRYVTETM